MGVELNGVAETKDPIAIAFGEAIRLARTRAKKTQKQIAREIGYDPVSLSRVESGEITPGLGTAVKIMAAVGVLPVEMEPLAHAAAPNLKIRLRTVPRLDRRLDVLTRMMPQVFAALQALGEAVDLPLEIPSPDEIARRLVGGGEAE